MKKLFLLLLLAIPIYGQSAFTKYMQGTHINLNDSLFTTYIDTSATPDDTTTAISWKYIPLNFGYEWGTIAIQDTGTGLDDSLVVEQGLVQYTGNPATPTKSDTVWYQVSLRDSLWGLVASPTVDDNSMHAYTVYVPLMDVIRVRSTNVQAVNNRVVYITGTFKRITGR